jgi:putative ABC transport system permease protein
VAVSSSLLSALGDHVGDSIDVQALVQGGDMKGTESTLPSRTLRITGVYDNPNSLDDQFLVARPGTFAKSSNQNDNALVAVPGGVSWNLVQQLNDHGYIVESKQVMIHPPAKSDVPYYRDNPGAERIYTTGVAVSYAVAAIAVSMILLEVILLAGPAFAVSARRRHRDFGLLGAAGADGRRLRRIILADGVVLGLFGGLLGVAVGVAGGAIGLPFLSGLSRQEPGGFRVVPIELLGAAIVGVVTGVLAALAPAISTSRQDVLTALTGRRGQAKVPWKLPLVGVIAVGLGILLIFYGAFSSGINTLPIVGGIAIAELGVVACTPILVAWAGKLARFLPLAGRLALRDGARNRGRTAPAVAAILAAVAGASSVAMFIATKDAKDRAGYQSVLRPGEVGVNIQGDVGLDTALVVAKIGATLPVRVSAVLSGTDYSNIGPASISADIVRTPANMCPPPPTSQQNDMSAITAYSAVQGADPRCVDVRGMGSGGLGSSIVTSGGPEALKVLTGTDNPAAEDVLRRGGVVVFNPLDLATGGADPTVTMALQGMMCLPPGMTDPGGKQSDASCVAPQSVTLPAAVVPMAKTSTTALVAPGVLDKLGVKFAPMSVMFDTTRMPTAAEEQKANDAAASLGINNWVVVERGYQSNTFIGLLALAAVAGIITLGAAAVATGLAIADAQADLETLAAVGARPRVRRTLAGSQAAVTAGLGAVLGCAFGLVPAIGIIEAQSHGFARAVYVSVGPYTHRFQPGPTYLTVPWLFLGITILALPALAALGASVFTRSKIELTRRRG